MRISDWSSDVCSSDLNGIAEVIVTAQRREERAQDVPISITVITPQQMSNANITNSGDLATYTPSLSVNTRFGNENTSFAIRGFTQDLRTTASVATYFAEVVAPRGQQRSEEHTSELQSLMRISYAVFCFK